MLYDRNGKLYTGPVTYDMGGARDFYGNYLSYDAPTTTNFGKSKTQKSFTSAPTQNARQESFLDSIIRLNRELRGDTQTRFYYKEQTHPLVEMLQVCIFGGLLVIINDWDKYYKKGAQFISNNFGSITDYGYIGLISSVAGLGITFINGKVLELAGQKSFIPLKAIGMTAGMGLFAAGGLDLYSHFKRDFLNKKEIANTSQEFTQRETVAPIEESKTIISTQPQEITPTTRPANAAAIAADPSIQPIFEETVTSAAPSESPTLRDYFRVTAIALNIREGAGTNYGVDGKLARGSCVSVERGADDVRGFLEIMAQSANGTKIDGYVSAQYLSAIRPAPAACVATFQ